MIIGWVIIIILFAVTGDACTFKEEQSIRCDQHCISKGETESWLKDKKCICGNPSEPEKPIFKVHSNKLKGNVLIDKKHIYEEE